jgi:exopolysaccharide production protein ExoZ
MPEKSKLVGVQYLRAIAALMVAYYHLIDQIPAYSHELSFARAVTSRRLPGGVDIFFVISGFIMYFTGRKLSAGEFAWRRLARIVPLYWVLTLAVCGLALADGAMLHRTDVTVEYAAKSMLFIPYTNPVQSGFLFPLLVPGWTLNYEMAFYALFALGLLLPRYRMRFVVGVLGLLVASGVILRQPEMLSISGFYTSGILSLFAAGMILGWACTRGALRVPRWLCGSLLLAGCWGLLTDWEPVASDRWAEFASATAIVVAVVAWEQRFGMPQWRLPLLIGDASYSIYLAHLFAFGMVRSAWKHADGPAWAFAMIAMSAAIVLALVTYHAVERPSLRLLKRLRERRQDRLAAVGDTT